RARALGRRLTATEPYLAAGSVKEYGVERVDSVDDLCRRADYIGVHCYLSDETRHIIGRRHFDLMKPTAYLINCARGGVVDEAALIRALQRRKIAGAGLALFEQRPVHPNNAPLKTD